jgi:hypothetical protein
MKNDKNSFLVLIGVCLLATSVSGAWFYDHWFAHSRNPATAAEEECAKLASTVFGPTDQDFSGQKEAASLDRLREAVRPDPQSPFARYADLGFLTKGSFIDACYEKIPFRNSALETCVEKHLRAGLKNFGEGVAVFLDLGAAASVRLATILANEKGYLPVWKMGSEVRPDSAVPIENAVAELKYEIPRLLERKVSMKHPMPMLVMDAERGSDTLGTRSDNRSFYHREDYPASSELKAAGVHRVLWVTEPIDGLTNQRGYEAVKLAFGDLDLISEDLGFDPVDALLEYFNDGLPVFQLTINPIDCH